MNASLSKIFWSFTRSTLKPFKWFLAGQLMVAILWATCECIQPYVFKKIINALAVVQINESLKHLIFFIFVYWLINLIFFLNFRFYDWIILHTKPFIKESIMKNLTNKAMAHSHAFYLQQFTGSLTNKISDVATGVPSLINSIIGTFFAHTLAIILAIYTVWQVDIRFSLAMISWAIFYLCTTYFLNKKGKEIAFQAANIRSSIVGHIADILSNIMNVRLFANRRYEQKHFDNALQVYVKAEQKRHTFSLTIHTIQGFSFVLFQGICIFFLIKGFQKRAITAGDFGLILTINSSIVDCLWNLSKEFSNFIEDYGLVTQGLQIISSPPSIKDISNAKELKVQRGSIHFHNITFQYPNGTSIYENFTVRIEPQQKIGGTFN